MREVIDAALERCGLEPQELENRPRSRAASQAKRLAIWAWVHEYEGQQIEIARALGLRTGAVSYHFACAVREAGRFDEECTALVALLRRRARPRPRVKTSAAADSLPVRYVVDVNES